MRSGKPATTTPPLHPGRFTPLPLGAVRPAGWLRAHLRTQADGLSGHLHEFWPDVRDSGWIGGASEGWERGPYWLDGVLPLAVLLEDAPLLRVVHKWCDYILKHQHADGWLGPRHDATYGYAHDPWPTAIVLKALTQYYEHTGDARVPAAMERCFARIADTLAEQPLQMWAQARWADLVLSVLWLYERWPSAALLQLAHTLREQGIDWRAHFAEFPTRTKRTMMESAAAGTYLVTHGVNVAMGLRQPGIWYRVSGDATERDVIHSMLATLDEYHGQATGVFTGDEHLAGTHPSQGTELCLVVELMYSLELMLGITGDAALGDRLERVAYNTLPATFSPDMWAHQYVQQANQVVCAVTDDALYTDDAPDANIFGLEPKFGCCAANMHQGWPKFAAHLWMRTPEGGLAAVAYAPCIVQTEAGGADVTVEVETDYPFTDTIGITVRSKGSTAFPLELRIPGWAEGATVVVNGAEPEPAGAGEWHRMERTWLGETRIRLHFPAAAQLEQRPGNGVALVRGPLLFAFPVAEEWRYLRGDPPHADYEVHPTEPWNYALRVDPAAPDAGVTFESRAVGDVPFSPGGAPVRAQVRARTVPAWGMANGAADTVPPAADAVGPEDTITLIPYGCTNLRITEFPRLT